MVQSAVVVARRAQARTWSLARRLEAVDPRRVLATFVVLQWLLVLGIALVVRHSGWVYYQGGDQLWYYTTGWLLGHGQFPQPGVGYLWCILLAPIALAGGPNLVQVYPAIIVLQFLVLLPVALFCVYGIAVRIGGRLFGYWAGALWLLVPLIAIKYTDAGYHQRFTEVTLPQGLGLTAMADFPTMVAALVSMYFCARLLADEPHPTFDALAAGLAGGAAVAIKPATALVLFGPVLAFLVARSWRAAGWYAVGIAPAVITLAFVKYRGFGYLPLFHAGAGMRLAAGAGAVAVTGGIGHYLPFHGHQFLTQLDQIREHFWSARLVEWFVLAGTLALFIRSRRYGALIFGWFAPIVLIKTASARADMEGGGLLRVLMPAYPAFVLMLAALPFLVPGVARRMARGEGALPPLLSARARVVALVAALIGTAVVPFAAYAIATPLRGGPGLRAAAMPGQGPPIPIALDLGVTARKVAGGVLLTWRAQHPAGGPVFYAIFRRWQLTPLYTCAPGQGADFCGLRFDQMGTSRSTQWLDRHPDRTRATVYYVGVVSNWLDDTTQGDVYVLSRGAPIRP